MWGLTALRAAFCGGLVGVVKSHYALLAVSQAPCSCLHTTSLLSNMISSDTIDAAGGLRKKAGVLKDLREI